LDREALLTRLRAIAGEALREFPRLTQVRLFGSLARGDETGLSDVDVFLLVESDQKDPLERMKPYYFFFTERLALGLDMIVATEDELGLHRDILKGSILLSG
jgi:predicted nucleotidyltransferase